MQTFLSSIGFTEQQIYMHATMFQAVNVLTILLCARFADTKNVLLRTALVQLPGALLFLGYLPLCLSRDVSAASYVWLLVISILQSAVFALHTVCEYKIPYYIYRADAYGSVLAVCGIISSVVSFAVGSAMSALSTRYSYPSLMIGAFSLSCLFLLFMDQLLTLMGVDENVWEHAKTYMVIVSFSGPFALLANCFSGILRAEGQANVSMTGTLIGNLVDLVLNPIMIIWLGWEIAGAATGG
mgnify:CR=1 FL=1